MSTARYEASADDVAAAIAYIEDCRRTHVDWAEWQEGNPDWRDHVEPDDPGGPDHHREWVDRYDEVLAVLRWASTKVRGQS